MGWGGCEASAATREPGVSHRTRQRLPCPTYLVKALGVDVVAHQDHLGVLLHLLVPVRRLRLPLLARALLPSLPALDGGQQRLRGRGGQRARGLGVQAGLLGVAAQFIEAQIRRLGQPRLQPYARQPRGVCGWLVGLRWVLLSDGRLGGIVGASHCWPTIDVVRTTLYLADVLGLLLLPTEPVQSNDRLLLVLLCGRRATEHQADLAPPALARL